MGNKKKPAGAEAPQDPTEEKMAALEAEVERLTAENIRLQNAYDDAAQKAHELRDALAAMPTNEGSVSFQKTARNAPAPRVDTVIEHGGAFYRVKMPKFVIKGRMMLATDLLTDTDGSLVASLMAEYPQLFELMDNQPIDA